MSTIVAFDLGSITAGCVVLEGERIMLAWDFKVSAKHSLGKRLCQLQIWLAEIGDLVGRGEADIVAVEAPYLDPQKPRAVFVLGQVLGLVRNFSWWATKGTSLMEIAPSTAKLALAGHGGADKEAMMKMANSLYPVEEVGVAWSQHTADALGVALSAAGKLKLEALAATAQPAPNTGAPGAL